MTDIDSDTSESLKAQALSAAGMAYAPYSRFRVGAAVLTAQGNVYTGCNVENGSFGLTNCAERVAIGAAVAGDGPSMEIVALAVVTADEVPAAPCGACRQVISEFGIDSAIIFNGPDGPEVRRAGDLLPGAFRLDIA